jgi:tellurite resistance-related uncharacterized protein
MERGIDGFHQDEHGDWVAELECGHNQHVRHKPPWQSRPWVVTEGGRRERLGQRLPCVYCDRRELPEGARRRRVTPTFDESDIPAGLRSQHTTKRGVWAVVHVLEGTLAVRLYPPLEARHELTAGQTAVLPPELPHEVAPVGQVRFYVELLTGRPKS